MPSDAVRLPLDAAGERSAARLRALAGTCAVIASAWLLLVAGTLLPRLLAVAGCALGAALLRHAQRQRARSGVDHYLEIAPDELVLAEGAALRRVPLARIDAVEIDEDRLVVVVRVHGDAPLTLSPGYGGLGLRALAERIWAARVRPAES